MKSPIVWGIYGAIALLFFWCFWGRGFRICLFFLRNRFARVWDSKKKFSNIRCVKHDIMLEFRSFLSGNPSSPVASTNRPTPPPPQKAKTKIYDPLTFVSYRTNAINLRINLRSIRVVAKSGNAAKDHKCEIIMQTSLSRLQPKSPRPSLAAINLFSHVHFSRLFMRLLYLWRY